VRFALRRAGQAAIVIVAVATLAFVLIHLAPGDPFPTALDDPSLTDAVRARLRAQFGFDRPLFEQYLRFLWNYLRGDFGWSVARNMPVATAIADALPRTVLLMATGLVAGTAGGERLVGLGAVVVYAVPEFLLAMGMIALFALRLRWFPMSGIVDARSHDALGAAGRAADVLRHLALPAATLALVVAASVSRYHRAAMLAVLPEDFIRTARAKGLSERDVVLRHALPNAMGAVLALGGLLIPALFGGAAVIEKFFDWPGMGRLMFNAALGRDYHLVVAGVVLSGALVAAGTAIADVVAAAFDPAQELDA